MKKNWIMIALSLGLCLAGCDKQPAANPEPDPDPVLSQEEVDAQKTRLYVNTFAHAYMDAYYLWNAEIRKDLDAWKETDEPIEKVQKIRYKNAKGEDIDRWTMLTDDFSSFYGSVTGNQKTYGFDFTLYGYDGTTACAVVTYTYADSPAADVGLKRGDAIYKVNGKTLPLVAGDDGKLYLSTQAIQIVNDELLGGDRLVADVSRRTEPGSKTFTDVTLTLTSREMYENPVLLSKVFDCDGKKVGYLVYTSFTMDSYADLIAACKGFKEAGVTELILDLRYNGGGFAMAEQFLASMLAPEAAVKAGDILATEIYNADLTEYFKSYGRDTNTYFTTEYSFNSGGKDYKFSTDGANIGLEKIYAIISAGSASASEALLCDLYPYMDITLVGEQSHGKYTTGIMLEGPEFYEDNAEQVKKNMGSIGVTEGKKYTDNWGLYVMWSRFADKNGETRCMPDGLTPDHKADDDPSDAYQLGDPQERMLATALALCGYKAKTQLSRRPAPVELGERVETAPHRADFGRFIVLPPKF